ncbi:MAG: DUF4384 domain-containing protein [Spirochaetota bacterium]
MSRARWIGKLRQAIIIGVRCFAILSLEEPEMRKPSCLSLCLLFILSCGLPAALAAEAPGGFAFNMAFLKYDKGTYQGMAFARPFTLKDGDRFQLFLNAGSQAFAYVLYSEPGGRLSLLFQSSLVAGKDSYLPSATDGYKVSPPAGTERLYVIVSLERQVLFEKAVAALGSGDSGARAATVMDEIARIKQSLDTLAELPEKPVPMGGVTRGSSPITASQFSGQKTYVKTIRFDH